MNTLSENYTFEITSEGDIQVITLTQIKTGAIRRFPSIGKSVRGLTNHMMSMTEDTCKPYFK